MTHKDYEQKIYASWLGKLIGIRLGAPIENWLGKDVRKMYHPIHSYLVDYNQFAADDDANGPLFFSSVMEDYNLDNIDEEVMGNHLLNVVGDHTGFFWWGGNGISTEETAYTNLRKGLPAPITGSIEMNGQAIAEQIGGQIFSDCWGYITLGNVKDAVKLAERMAMVTHDGDGLEGAKFVSACISLAWNEKDIKTIIDQAKEYLIKSSSYYALINEIEEFYEKYPNDSSKCLAYIEDKHSYEHYEGVCHILPNTAIMLYGMLYGHNDFDETMRLIAEAGRDTDCNLGNVGSIMGMMLGLEGIDEKWIKPFNDILLSSSSIGSKNITTISNSAKYFCELGCKLYNIPYEKKEKNIISYDFDLPYATAGFEVTSNRYASASLRIKNKLQINLDNVLKGKKVVVSKKSYFTSEEVYDCRYEPQYTPVIEVGDKIHFKMINPEDLLVRVELLYSNDDGEVIRTPVELNKEQTIEIKKMSDSQIITHIAFEIKALEHIQQGILKLQYFKIEKCPHVEFNFSEAKVEDWGLSFDEKHIQRIRGLDIYQGDAEITSEGLLLKGNSAFNLSSVQATFNQVEIEVDVNNMTKFTLAYSYNGTYKYRGFRFDYIEGELMFIHRDALKDGYMQRVEYLLETEDKIRLILELDKKHLTEETRDYANIYPLYSDIIAEMGSLAIINESSEDLKISYIKAE